MPSLFPALFDFSLIAVFVLRVTAGVFFWIFGARLLHAAYEITGRGVALRALGFAYGFAKLAVGLLLTVGVFTQIGAIAGMLLSALTFAQGVSTPNNKSTQQVQMLLFILCFSLLFFGAGAFGIDLQL